MIYALYDKLAGRNFAASGKVWALRLLSSLHTYLLTDPCHWDHFYIDKAFYCLLQDVIRKSGALVFFQKTFLRNGGKNVTKLQSIVECKDSCVASFICNGEKNLNVHKNGRKFRIYINNAQWESRPQTSQSKEKKILGEKTGSSEVWRGHS